MIRRKWIAPMPGSAMPGPKFGDGAVGRHGWSGVAVLDVDERRPAFHPVEELDGIAARVHHPKQIGLNEHAVRVRRFEEYVDHAAARRGVGPVVPVVDVGVKAPEPAGARRGFVPVGLGGQGAIRRPLSVDANGRGGLKMNGYDMSLQRRPT